MPPEAAIRPAVRMCLRAFNGAFKSIFCENRKKVWPKFCGFKNSCYLCIAKHGVLAHLARARHWQCRGERFESAILHIFKVVNNWLPIC